MKSEHHPSGCARVAHPLSGLYDYRSGRYADRVVLTFSDIEDLIGGPLPELANREEWWRTATDGSPSSQSPTWTEANRSARPNVIARNVTFDRLSER
jgi:hypothetical protein